MKSILFCSKNDLNPRPSRGSCVSVAKTGLILFLAGLSFSFAELTANEMEFFENKVRPILVNECYKCHSIEKGSSKGGLTLDSMQGMLKGGESGEAALVPGDPDKSLMIQAIRYTNPDLQMPAKYQLKAEEIEALTEWVRMGAPDPRKAPGIKLSGLNEQARSHWAFQKVSSPSLPLVKNSIWGQSPIDTFVLAKLEEKQMTPSTQADKETLIRRAYYDLIGLPPNPAQIEAFKTDKSRGAFAKVVDELLSSPQYGERWGRHWLDTVRYSDTIGANINTNNQILKEYRFPYAWSYRDYVIRSFNEDKPYHQFIIEQLASDQLPESAQNPEILAALGFLTVGERFKNKQDEINEKIDTVSKGFLGMTVSCARCHDHPFDPIPTTDYYALHGIFSSTMEPQEKPMISVPIEPEYSEYLKRKEELEKRNKEDYLNLVIQLNARFLKNAPAFLTVIADSIKNKQNPKNRKQALPPEINTQEDREFIDGLTILILKNERQNSLMTLFKRLASFSDAEIAKQGAEVYQKFLKDENSKAFLPQRLEIALQQTPIKSHQNLVDLYAKLFAEIQPTSEIEIRRLFASNTESEPSPQIDPLIQFPLEIYPESQLDTEKLTSIVQGFSRPLEKFILSSKNRISFSPLSLLELTAPGAPARAMIVKDVAKPKNSPVLIRGQVEMPGAIVPRAFLSILSPEGQPQPFREGSGRLELARAIANPKNPLTVRAMVNRVWMWHFGSGLVSTPDNLGTQSEAPSHPELLDYLSNAFIDNGWSIKALHRLMMLSSTYQQNASDRTEYTDIDPQNRLLWRANIRRLDFESIRDSLISFGGTLDTTLGGKPVNLVDEPYSHRRSVYGYIDRGNLPELMTQFDFSNPDATNSQRSSTVVPQQALFLMNSPMIIEVVRNILNRSEFTQAATEGEKIIALYRIVLQRTPEMEEVDFSREFLKTVPAKRFAEKISEEQLLKSKSAAHENDSKKKEKKIGKKETVKNEGIMVKRTPLTAWEALAQSLIFLNETIYVN